MVLVQVVFTSLGYVAYFRFQKVADPVYFSKIGYVISATGVGVTFLLFDEPSTGVMLLAVGVMAAGIKLVNKAANETPPHSLDEADPKEALIDYDRTVLRALQETDDAFKAYDAAGSTLGLSLLDSAANRQAARLARVRFSAGEGIYLDVLEAERSDFASRRALAVARTNQLLAVVSIYKALGGGWEICAQVDQDCGGADGMSNRHVVKLITHRP